MSVVDVEERFRGFTWNRHQTELSNHEGSALLVAPTGSGKTEAALLWAARQRSLGTDGRLWLLLPYQASLNAMQRRLTSRLFPGVEAAPEKWNEYVGMVHGRTARAFYEAFLSQEHAPAEAETLAREQNELARLFAAPIGIGTIFSIVRLLFATKGAERLFVPFHRARVVIDEIHAYDPNLAGMAIAVLRFLQDKLQARILLMSATVPEHFLAALHESLKMPVIRADARSAIQTRHSLQILDTNSLSAESLQRLTECAQRGSTLVVVNQVRRAIELRKALSGAGLHTSLLHSRFHAADRSALERDLRPAAGSVLVATQAVEVSLDLDFDFCFSELAPMESIAQRFGRCNRRGLQQRPAQVFVFSHFPEGNAPERPYQADHLRQVVKVLQAFCDGRARALSNHDTEELLQRSYPERLKEELRRQIVEKAAAVSRLFLEEWQPFGLFDASVVEQLESAWEEFFDGQEVLPGGLLERAKEHESWLGRTRYLVPISGLQFRRFHREGLIEKNEDLNLFVIHRPYDSNGLDLHSPIN